MVDMELSDLPLDLLDTIGLRLSLNDLQRLACTSRALRKFAEPAAVTCLLARRNPPNLRLSFIDACSGGHLHACRQLLSMSCSKTHMTVGHYLPRAPAAAACEGASDNLGDTMRPPRPSGSAAASSIDTDEGAGLKESGFDSDDAQVILCCIGLIAASKSGAGAACRMVVLPSLAVLLARSPRSYAPRILLHLTEAMCAAAMEGHVGICVELCDWLQAQREGAEFIRRHAACSVAKAMSYAVKYGQTPACEALLSHPLYGSYLAATAEDHTTFWQAALLSAAAAGNEQVCRMLVLQDWRRRPWSLPRDTLLVPTKLWLCRALLALPHSLLPTVLRNDIVEEIHSELHAFPHANARGTLLQALHLAAKAGHTSTCRLLLDCGPHDRVPLRETCGDALRFPAARGDVELLRLLLKEVRRGGSKAEVFETRALCHATAQSRLQVSPGEGGEDKAIATGYLHGLALNLYWKLTGILICCS